MSDSYPILVATDARLLKRSCESLIGIASGLIADGDLNNLEIQFLATWLDEHPELATTWPGEIVYKRVREALSDGVITTVERDYLCKTLGELVGGSFSVSGAAAAEPSGLPVDRSVEVAIPASSFCFSGEFVFGTRTACERAVEQRGGRVTSVGKKLNYLVIGEMASRDWKYSAFGSKIEAAMKLKQEGLPLAIVSEQQWVRAL